MYMCGHMYMYVCIYLLYIFNEVPKYTHTYRSTEVPKYRSTEVRTEVRTEVPKYRR